MEYVAMIGLLFAPIVCLLCAAWFYVRWQNEHEDQALAQRDRRVVLPWSTWAIMATFLSFSFCKGKTPFFWV